MLTESFLDYLRFERNYSDKTIVEYGRDIAQFRNFLQEGGEEFAPGEVKPEMIREWIVSLMDGGCSSSSVNRKLSSLRSFYKYLLKRGEVTKDPLRKITGPKKKKTIARIRERK